MIDIDTLLSYTVKGRLLSLKYWQALWLSIKQWRQNYSAFNIFKMLLPWRRCLSSAAVSWASRAQFISQLPVKCWRSSAMRPSVTSNTLHSMSLIHGLHSLLVLPTITFDENVWELNSLFPRFLCFPVECKDLCLFASAVISSCVLHSKERKLLAQLLFQQKMPQIFIPLCPELHCKELHRFSSSLNFKDHALIDCKSGVVTATFTTTPRTN